MARIALVHDVAGIATVQARLLRSAGHEVDQLRLSSIGAAWEWPVKAVALPIRLAAYLPIIRKLRARNYDVVHIHWVTHGIVGVLARRPFFVQAHGSDLHVNLGNAPYRAVARRVLGAAKTVFYVTPNLRAYLSDYDSKAVYLPNPVDVQALGERAELPTEVRKVVIFTRLDPVKGVDQIFPAVERLSRTVHVTALDWGPLSREYVGRYGRWATFVKPLPHDEIGAFLSQFDLVIGQMHQGILSLMEIEALGAGRPLITALDASLYSSADPPPVVAAFNADDIVAAVERLQADPAPLADLSRRGRDWALRNHGYEHHLGLLLAAYFGSAVTDPAVAAPAPR